MNVQQKLQAARSRVASNRIQAAAQRVAADKDYGDSDWPQSKWWPKELDRDDDPVKVTFDALVKDAIQNEFPASIKGLVNRSLRYYGSVFDSSADFMYSFEDNSDAFLETPVQDIYDDLARLGHSLQKLEEASLASMTKFAELCKIYNERTASPSKVPYSKLEAAFAKLKTPVAEVAYGVKVSLVLHRLGDLALKGEHSLDLSEKEIEIEGGEKPDPKDLVKDYMARVWALLERNTNVFDILSEPRAVTFTLKPTKVDFSEQEYKDWYL